MPDPCPICGGAACVPYPYMDAEYAAGRNRRHWIAIHDRINGAEPGTPPGDAPPPSPEDLAIRAHAARGGGCCH